MCLQCISSWYEVRSCCIGYVHTCNNYSNSTSQANGGTIYLLILSLLLSSVYSLVLVASDSTQLC